MILGVIINPLKFKYYTEIWPGIAQLFPYYDCLHNQECMYFQIWHNLLLFIRHHVTAHTYGKLSTGEGGTLFQTYYATELLY